MSYAANLRGWGPGWPTDRSADMEKVYAPESGADFLVHRDVAPILAHILAEIEWRGFLIDHGLADVDDDWSYSKRPIRGTEIPSNHSWGLAVDINAQDWPQGQRKRRPPQWIVDIFEFWGWEWGGDWSNPDPMHFEYRGSRAEARWTVAALAASYIEGKPVPAPPTVPPSVPPPVQLEDDDMPILRNHHDGSWWLYQGGTRSQVHQPALAKLNDHLSKPEVAGSVEVVTDAVLSRALLDSARPNDPLLTDALRLHHDGKWYLYPGDSVYRVQVFEPKLKALNKAMGAVNRVFDLRNDPVQSQKYLDRSTKVGELR